MKSVTSSQVRILVGVILIAVTLSLVPVDRAQASVGSPLRGAGYTVNAPALDPDLSDFDRQISTVADNGGTWVRFGASYYDLVSSTNSDGTVTMDESALDVVDAAMDKARSKGLQIYFITADGISSDDDRTIYRSIMADYWGELSDRFADRVSVWQVYNEPNGRDYVGWDASVVTDDAYLEKLASDIGLAREVIRQRNADVLITTNAGGFPVDDALEAEWQRVFDILGDSVDAVSVSAYPQFNETAIAELPAELEYLGDRYDKPVIVAEVGLQTCDTCWISEEQQGYYVGKTIDSIATADVLATLVYELQDRGTDGEGTFGSLRLDGTPKVAAQKIFDAVANY